MTIHPSMDQQMQDEIAVLRAQGLERKMRRIDGVSGTRITIDGRSLVCFGSNDYLGLAGHPAVLSAARSAISHGAGATGSRLTSGNSTLNEDLERGIARFKHSEAAIVFSSGYAANIGTIPALAGAEDLILSDYSNHACIIDGCRLSRATVRVFPHADAVAARRLLTDRAEFRRLLIVTDGVFSMDGDLAPLPDLAAVAEEYDGWLMVDDAHGAGVFGESGSGVVEHFGLHGRIPVQMGTLSKAAGTLGGFVAGSQALISMLRSRARSFLFSTALPPASLAAAAQAIEIIAGDPARRARLRENVQRTTAGLRALNVAAPMEVSPIIPIVFGGAQQTVRASEDLERAGYWAPAIRPPTVPDGSSRLRITLSAAHTHADIDGFIEALARVLQGRVA